MPTTTSQGICLFCKQTFGKAAISRHLKACTQRATASKQEEGKLATQPTTLLHIRAEAHYQPTYWLHLEMSASDTLDALDGLLRDAWLECCGHLSAFRIKGLSYSSYTDTTFGDRSMDVPLDTILAVGDKFEYEYDFGSTTKLLLKVLGQREQTLPTTDMPEVELLAHNSAPTFSCDNCGKPAKNICTECMYSQSGGLCAACSKKHPCGTEMLLPIVNSPRLGVCGYTGPGL